MEMERDGKPSPSPKTWCFMPLKAGNPRNSETCTAGEHYTPGDTIQTTRANAPQHRALPKLQTALHRDNRPSESRSEHFRQNNWCKCTTKPCSWQMCALQGEASQTVAEALYERLMPLKWAHSDLAAMAGIQTRWTPHCNELPWCDRTTC